MSLSTPFGRGPLQPDKRAASPALPNHARYWEPWPRRMRAQLDGRTVVDSRRGVIFWETDSPAAILYPRDDVDTALSDDQVSAGPVDEDGTELVPGYVAVDFGAMDGWYEEDQPVYAHPRDPYHRVDVLASSQHVVARVGDTVIADSTRPKLLFETGLPIRYYVPLDDVAAGVLAQSDTVTVCPYKGDGQHWHVDAGGQHLEDAVWTLPHPRPEALLAEQHACFYADKVDITVDDEPVTA